VETLLVGDDHEGGDGDAHCVEVDRKFKGGVGVQTVESGELWSDNQLRRDGVDGVQNVVQLVARVPLEHLRMHGEILFDIWTWQLVYIL